MSTTLHVGHSGPHKWVWASEIPRNLHRKSHELKLEARKVKKYLTGSRSVQLSTSGGGFSLLLNLIQESDGSRHRAKARH